MQLGQQIKMRQSQSLVMTPQLQQAIKLLQMTNLELCQYLENQQAENPFLEIDNNTQESKDEDYQSKDITSNLSDDMESGKSISEDPSNNQDYENRYETELSERPKLDSPSPISKNTSTEDFDDYISNLASRPETLKEYVRKQISLELKESKDLLIASVLTDYLEPTGWLSTNIEDIANEINCHVDEINSVLIKLQKLEPAGVFARNLSECLKIQLEEKSLLSEGIEALLDNLDLLAKGELRQLIKITNFTQEEISKSITLIRSLNPKPGETFLFDETIQNSPDVIVSKGRNGWVVELNKSTLPAVVIDENYISKLSSKKTRY
jgi:RNA polymerase sigma-54 factor